MNTLPNISEHLKLATHLSPVERELIETVYECPAKSTWLYAANIVVYKDSHQEVTLRQALEEARPQYLDTLEVVATPSGPRVTCTLVPTSEDIFQAVLYATH
jgi:hypothetical protein